MGWPPSGRGHSFYFRSPVQFEPFCIWINAREKKMARLRDMFSSREAFIVAVCIYTHCGRQLAVYKKNCTTNTCIGGRHIYMCICVCVYYTHTIRMYGEIDETKTKNLPLKPDWILIRIRLLLRLGRSKIPSPGAEVRINVV